MSCTASSHPVSSLQCTELFRPPCQVGRWNNRAGVASLLSDWPASPHFPSDLLRDFGVLLPSGQRRTASMLTCLTRLPAAVNTPAEPH